MKLTAIILLAACLQVSAKGYSQKITLSVKDAPLEQVFTSIEKQSDYSFNYYHELIKQARPVTIRVKDATLEEVLAVCFKEQPFTFTVINRLIIIKEKKQIVFAETERQDQAPPIDVSGKVTDENGGPLQGANVVEKGKQNGTTTNTDGVFLLKGVDENGSLVISYVGYQTLTIPVNNRTSIVVSIKQNDADLQEVVINKGYYTEAKRFSTGNVGHVTSKEIERQPVQNPLLALQGRVPGVEVTQLTGLPGGGVKVRIQGQNSIASGLDPLIVIDGVSFPSELIEANKVGGYIVKGGSPLNYINPADIESIDILKDADATSIYGSRAANGAILITTKKGKAGKAKLTVDARQGWAKVARRVDMLNTQQYVQMRKEAITNDGYAAYLNDPAFNEYWPDLNIWDTTRYTDWQKTLTGGTAQNTNVNASISGGSANVQYLIGGHYNRQTTAFPGDFHNKAAGLHFNTSVVSSNQKFRISLSGTYTNDQNHLPSVDLTEMGILTEPNAPALYNQDGTLNWAPDAAGQSTWTNPLAYTQNSDFINSTNNLVSNVVLSYRLLPGLSVQSSLGYTNIRNDLYNPWRLEVEKPEKRSTAQRTASYGTRNMSSWIMEPQLTYSSRLFNGKLEGLFGTTIQQISSSFFSVQGIGYLSDLLMKSLSAAQSIKSEGNMSEVTRFNALYGRVGYNWADKYLVNITMRRDGSNKFGDKNKFHNFGSLGVGWIFSSEKWVQQHLPFLNFGKLRSSFGTTGNDQIAAFSYLNIYTIDNPSVLYQNNIGLTTNVVANPYLEWEETKKWLWGMDLGFFQDRITLGASYSLNRSSNQLIAYTIPALTGFNAITKNLPATVQNTSWEFILNTMNLKGRSFSWTSNLNLTIPRNKLLNFPGIELTPYAHSDNVIVGQPLGMTKVYPGAPLDAATGKYQVYDKNGNLTSSFTDSVEKTVMISPFPSWYGGFQNAIHYKNFQLDFFFQFIRTKGRKDFYYSNGNQLPGQFFPGVSNQPVSVLNRWQKPGDHTDIGPYYAFTSVSFWPERSDALYSYDASYIRLKNLAVSWQLPQKWLNKNGSTSTGMNARLYFSGQNLFTITKYTGLDPETMSTGTLPPLRIWTIGIHMEL